MDSAPAVRDAAFLTAVVLLSLILYVGRLGFYTDDWAFLGYLTASGERSVTGLFRSIHSPHVAMRPVQLLYMATLFRLFGQHPFGYHLVQSGMLVILAVLGYLTLRELRQPRLLAVTVPAVYLLLPHYSTDRFWFATFMITLSMVLYVASLYAQLRAVGGNAPRFAAWLIVGVLALWGSTLAYELTIPLFLLNPWLVARFGRRHAPRTRRATLATLLAVQLLALLPVAAFKAATTTRMTGQGSLVDLAKAIVRQAVRLDYGAGDYGLNVLAGVRVAFGDYGFRLPSVLWRIAREQPDPTVLLGGAGLALLVAAYLLRLPRLAGRRRRRWLGCVKLGLLVFGLGYAIFLTNMNVQFSPSGIANRTAMAAALGVALVFVGAAGVAASLARTPGSRHLAFAAMVGLLCGSGFVVTNTLASFWVEAYRRERAILAELDRRFPAMPSETTLILDGICPYAGPAPVFESSWDLAGAILMRHRDYTLRADVVTPRLSVGEHGLTTIIYGSMRTDYPYGERLIVYDARTGAARSLPDAAAARAYFASPLRQKRPDCPIGYEGRGVAVF